LLTFVPTVEMGRRKSEPKNKKATRLEREASPPPLSPNSSPSSPPPISPSSAASVSSLLEDPSPKKFVPLLGFSDLSHNFLFRRMHFTDSQDIALLREVIKVNPFGASHGAKGKGWEEVASTLSQKCPGLEKLKADRARKRVLDSLLPDFKGGEQRSRRGGGD